MSEKRTEMVNIRLKPEEAAAWRQAAEESGRTVAGLIRFKVNEALKKEGRLYIEKES